MLYLYCGSGEGKTTQKCEKIYQNFQKIFFKISVMWAFPYADIQRYTPLVRVNFFYNNLLYCFHSMLVKSTIFCNTLFRIVFKSQLNIIIKLNSAEATLSENNYCPLRPLRKIWNSIVSMKMRFRRLLNNKFVTMWARVIVRIMSAQTQNIF